MRELNLFLGLLISTSLFAQKKDTTVTKLENGMELWQIKSGVIVLEEGAYNKGKKDGVWKEYNSTGAFKSISTYKNGLLDGPSIAINNKGFVTSETNYKEGKKDGALRKFTYDKYSKDPAALSSVETYQDDKLNGYKRKNYSKKTTPQEEGYWKDGERHGVTKWYGQDGKLVGEFNYKNGNLDGLYKAYHSESGALREEGMYVNNERDGVWKEYDESGKLINTTKYKDGIAKGKK